MGGKMNNNDMPIMILGTAPFKQMGNYNFLRIRTMNAVKNAIFRGYGIDCAVAYGNHRQVGRGIQVSGKAREKIFLTSKLYNTQQDNYVREHYNVMCNELGVQYLDLLLQHWPQTSTYINTWKQMEELYLEEKVKYIGIANAEIRHLDEIKKKCDILPHFIQIERNPLNTQLELISFCKKDEIRVQAYAPLGRMGEDLIKQTILNKLALKYQKSIPQIILRWQIQTGVIPVVRSVRKKRIFENIDICDFEMADEEIEEITGLNQNYKIYDPRKYARYY